MKPCQEQIEATGELAEREFHRIIVRIGWSMNDDTEEHTGFMTISQKRPKPPQNEGCLLCCQCVPRHLVSSVDRGSMELHWPRECSWLIRRRRGAEDLNFERVYLLANPVSLTFKN